MSKPKIDLKARLGRRPGATPASASIPPPTGVHPPHQTSATPMGHGFPGQLPGGQLPGQSPGQGGGFGHAQPQQLRPSYEPMSMGGAPVIHAPAPVHAASISFEGDEEFAAVRRGGRKKVMILAAVAALVGGVLGFAVGGLSEKNKVAEAAVVGAKTLVTEIDAANAAVTKLSEVLNSAAQSLKDGKYPENEVKDLGGINIPFDGTNLSGKSIGRFKPQLLTMLISYAEAASAANSQKDKIRGLLSYSKEGVEQLLAQKSSPQVHWGVVIQQGPQGPWGSMQVLPSAFPVSAKKGEGGWPSEFELRDGNQKVSLKRYTGGDPARGSDGGQIIPVAPHTQGTVCPSDTIVRLRRELSDMQKILSGDETPGQEVTGIAQLGDSIKKQLSAIGG